MKQLLTLLLTFGSFFAQANDSIFIKLNKLKFSPGDTLTFSCNVANYQALGLEAATMNIWIEDMNKTAVYKFRYPMINGQLPKTRLAISDSMKQGVYAINFIIQKGLFSVFGKIRDNKISSLKYFILTNERQTYTDTVPVSKDGNFVLQNIVFDAEASVMLSPAKSRLANDLFIDVVTPLDSFFVPEAVLTQFITVGSVKEESLSNDSYEFLWEQELVKGTLPHVTVTAKQKKKVQQFNDQYVSPYFKQDDAFAKWFDGFEDPQLSKTANLENFLMSRVPGFLKEWDPQNHTYQYTLRKLSSYRGETTTIYLNEMPLSSDFNINDINPSEIAVIKVINSPTMINRQGNGSAILIYTKRGSFHTDPNLKHNFVFRGYTPQVSTWP